MRRISTATRVVNKFGAGKDGFTNGDPVGGIAATDLEDVWFDHVQEEIATFVEAAGLVLDPANRSQLLAAVQTLFTAKTQVFGVGQTLQNVTASRALGTVYTNSTGKPILIYVQATVGSGQAAGLYMNGAIIGNYSNTTGTAQAFLTTAIIPAGYTYEVRNLNTVTLTSWYELRT